MSFRPKRQLLDADPLRFAVSKGLIPFHCYTLPELFIQKDHNLGIDRDSSLKRWKPLRLHFHHCLRCHRRNPFSTLHRTTSREHWNVWQKYCVIVLLIYDFFSLSPFRLEAETKNQKWWKDTFFGPIISRFVPSEQTLWFLTFCFSVYKINSLMRVLFVDCGLMMLFCVCTNRNICLVRIGVSIQLASPGAFTSIDFNLPAELGRGDGIHGLGLWSRSPISRLSRPIDFCWNQKSLHLPLNLNIPIADWPSDGRVPENPSQVPQSPEADFQKTANAWRAPNGQTISTSGMLIFCLLSCRFYRRCYLCRGTAKRKVLCCERKILGRQHEKVDVNDVREKR